MSKLIKTSISSFEFVSIINECGGAAHVDHDYFVRKAGWILGDQMNTCRDGDQYDFTRNKAYAIARHYSCDVMRRIYEKMNVVGQNGPVGR